MKGGAQRSFLKGLKKIKRFAQEIKNKLKIKIDFIDESFTTKIAEERRAEDIDQEAAVIILEDYLAKKWKNFAVLVLWL